MSPDMDAKGLAGGNDNAVPTTIEVGKPLPYFCPACQAIPRYGFCNLKGCPTAPPPPGGEDE